MDRGAAAFSLSLFLPGPLLENALQVDSALLQHLIADVGVHAGGGLVVAVADNLHYHQWVDAAFVEQGDIGSLPPVEGTALGRPTIVNLTGKPVTGQTWGSCGQEKATPHQSAAPCGTMKGCRFL